VPGFHVIVINNELKSSVLQIHGQMWNTFHELKYIQRSIII